MLCPQGCLSCQNNRTCDVCGFGYFINIRENEGQISQICGKCSEFFAISCILYDKRSQNSFSNHSLIDFSYYNSDFLIFLNGTQLISLECKNFTFLTSDFKCSWLSEPESILATKFLESFVKESFIKSFLIDYSSFQSILTNQGFEYRIIKCWNSQIISLNFVCEPCPNDCKKCYYGYYNSTSQLWVNYTDIQIKHFKSKEIITLNSIYEANLTMICESCYQNWTLSLDNFLCLSCKSLLGSSCAKCDYGKNLKNLLIAEPRGNYSLKLNDNEIYCTGCESQYGIIQNDNELLFKTCKYCGEDCPNCFFINNTADYLCVDCLNEISSRPRLMDFDLRKCYDLSLDGSLNPNQITKILDVSNDETFTKNANCRMFGNKTLDNKKSYTFCLECGSNLWDGLRSYPLFTGKTLCAFYFFDNFESIFEKIGDENFTALLMDSTKENVWSNLINSEPLFLENEASYTYYQPKCQNPNLQTPGASKCVFGPDYCEMDSFWKDSSKSTIYCVECHIYFSNYLQIPYLYNQTRSWYLQNVNTTSEFFNDNDLLNLMNFVSVNLTIFMNETPNSNTSCYSCKPGCSNCTFNKERNSKLKYRSILDNYKIPDCNACFYNKRKVSNYVYDYRLKTCKYCPKNWSNCKAFVKKTIMVNSSADNNSLDGDSIYIINDINNLQGVLDYFQKDDAVYFFNEFAVEELNLTILISPGNHFTSNALLLFNASKSFEKVSFLKKINLRIEGIGEEPSVLVIASYLQIKILDCESVIMKNLVFSDYQWLFYEAKLTFLRISQLELSNLFFKNVSNCQGSSYVPGGYKNYYVEIVNVNNLIIERIDFLNTTSYENIYYYYISMNNVSNIFINNVTLENANFLNYKKTLIGSLFYIENLYESSLMISITNVKIIDNFLKYFQFLIYQSSSSSSSSHKTSLFLKDWDLQKNMLESSNLFFNENSQLIELFFENVKLSKNTITMPDLNNNYFFKGFNIFFKNLTIYSNRFVGASFLYESFIFTSSSSTKDVLVIETALFQSNYFHLEATQLPIIYVYSKASGAENYDNFMFQNIEIIDEVYYQDQFSNYYFIYMPQQEISSLFFYEFKAKNSIDIAWFYIQNVGKIHFMNIYLERKELMFLLFETPLKLPVFQITGFISLNITNLTLKYFITKTSLVYLEGKSSPSNVVNIKDSEFSFNYLKPLIYVILSTVKFISSYKVDFEMKNTKFKSNFLDISEYSYMESSSAVYIEVSGGNSTISIIDSSFVKNSPSSAVINSDFINFQNVSFQNANYSIPEFLTHDFTQFNLTSMFSNSRFAFCSLTYKALIVDKSLFNFSQSYYAGALFLQGDSTTLTNTQFSNILSATDGGSITFLLVSYVVYNITIENSIFMNVICYNKGGSLFFDGNGIVNLKIINTKFYNSYSNNTGSVFYIDKAQRIEIILLNVWIYNDNELLENEFFEEIFLDKNFLGNLMEIDVDQTSNINTNFTIIDLIVENIDCDCSLIEQTQGLFFMKNSVFKNNRFGGSGMIYLANLNESISISNSSFSKNNYVKNSGSKSIEFTNFWSFNYSKASIILINNPTNKIKIIQTNFTDNTCFNCLGGVLSLIFSKSSFGTLIENLNFINNTEAAIGGGIYLYNIKKSSQNIALNSCRFEGNKVYYYGGAIYITNGFMNISSSDFVNNSVFAFDSSDYIKCRNESNLFCDYSYSLIENKGGAIYYEGYSSLTSLIYLESINFTDNNAGIGGAIYNYNSLLNILTNVNFLKNHAVLYGNGIYNSPMKIKMLKHSINDLEEIFESGTLTFENFQSNNQIAQLVFKLYDEEDMAVEIFEEEIEMKIEISKGDLNDTGIFEIQGIKTIDSNKTQGTFEFNSLTFVGSRFLTYAIIVTTSAIKNNYSYTFYINFRNCIKGERYIFTATQNGCEACPLNSYSLEENSTFCKPKKDYMNYSSKNTLILKSNYWRENYLTDWAEECKETKDFCFAEDDPRFIDSNSIYYNISVKCAQGHIGALCGSCDMYGIFWKEKYSKTSKYKCGLCSDTAFNAGILVSFLIVNVLSIALSVKGVVDMIDTDIELKIIRLMGFSFLNKKSTKSSIYLKMLVTYSQIIAGITSFDLKIPSEFNIFSDTLGNPTETLLYSTDCFIVNSFTYPPYIYLKVLFTFLMPFVYLLLFCAFYFLLVLTKLVKNRPRVFYTAFFFVMIYMQPNVITIFLSALSCKNVTEKNYVKMDLAYECYTNEHLYFSFLISIPALMIWTFIIPLFILYKLYNARHHLNHIENRIKYGFLYSEYKPNAYYWEFAKMYEKMIITIFLSFFETQTDIKGMMILLSIFIYFILLLYANPYKTYEFNMIDICSCIVEYFTIFFGIFAYQNVFLSLMYISYCIILILNVIFIVIVGKKLVVSMLADQMDTINKILPKIKKIMPCFFFWFKETPPLKSLNSWKKVRRAILRYLKAKNRRESKKNRLNSEKELDQNLREKIRIQIPICEETSLN